MITPQQNDEVVEAKLTRTNVAIFQAVLTSTSTPFNIDWQQAMDKFGATRADNFQRQFKDALRKLGLAYPTGGGDIVIAEGSYQLVPKKRGAIKNRGAAPKKPKTEEKDEEAKRKDEDKDKGKDKAEEEKMAEEKPEVF